MLRQFVCTEFVTILDILSATLWRGVPVLTSLCLYCICYNTEHFVCYIVTSCPCVDVAFSVLYLSINILSVTLLRGCPCVDVPLSVLYLLQYWTFCLLHCDEVSLRWHPFVCIVFVTTLNILSVTLLRGVPVLTSLCLYCICYNTEHFVCYIVTSRPCVDVPLSVLYLLHYWTFCQLHCYEGVPVLTSLCLYCIWYNIEHFVSYIVTRCPCVDVPLSVLYLIQYWTFCLLHCYEVSLCWRPFVCIVLTPLGTSLLLVTLLNILSVTLLRGVPVLTPLCLYCICYNTEHFVSYIVTRYPCVDVPLSVLYLLHYWTFCQLHCDEVSLCWRPFVCIVFVTILNILSVTLWRGVPVLTSLCLYCICYTTEHFVCYIVTRGPCGDVPLSVLYLLQNWAFCQLHCDEVSLCWRPFFCIVFVTILNILSVTLWRGIPVLTSLCLNCICYNTEHFFSYIVTRYPCVDVPLSLLYLLQYWTCCLLHCDEVSLCWRHFVWIVFLTKLNILSVTLWRGVPVLTSLCLNCICYKTEHFVSYIVTRCPCVDIPFSVLYLFQYWTFCLLHCDEVSLCWRPFVWIVFVTILNILSVTLLRGIPVLTSLCLYCICYNTEHFVCYIVNRCPCVDVPLSVLYLLQYWTFCLLHCDEVSLCWRPFVCIVFVTILNILSVTLLRGVAVLTSLCLYCICYNTEHFVSYIVTRGPCVGVPLSVLYLLQHWTFYALPYNEVSLCLRPFVCIVFVTTLNILSVTLLRGVPVLTSLCLYCICYNTEHFVCYIVTRCPCVDVPLSVLYLLQYWTFCLLHCYEVSLCWRPFVCIVFVAILNILSVTLLRGVHVLTSLCLYCICYNTEHFVCYIVTRCPCVDVPLSVLYLLQHWTFCLLHCNEMSLYWLPFDCIVFVTILNSLSVTLLRGVPVLTPLCLYCICYNTEHFVCYIVTRCPCVDVPLSVLYLLQHWTFCLLHCYEVSLCWRPFVCIVFVTTLNILSVTFLRGAHVLTSLCLYCNTILNI